MIKRTLSVLKRHAENEVHIFQCNIYCHILICESNNLGLILDKSNIKYLALLDDSMNLNQAKGFMTRFDIKIKFLKHLRGKKSVV